MLKKKECASQTKNLLGGSQKLYCLGYTFLGFRGRVGIAKSGFGYLQVLADRVIWYFWGFRVPYE